MLTRRRVVSALAVVVLLALGWTAWLAYQTARDLRTAEQAVDRIRAAVKAEDPTRRSEAIQELADASQAAKDRTAGLWWSGLTWVPFFGDDMGGVQDLSESLDLLATEAFVPLGDTVDELDSVVMSGRIDLDKLESLEPDVVSAHTAFQSALGIVDARDSSGFAGILRSRYDRYVSEVAALARDLSSAEDALGVLPTMLGSNEPRQYLLIFENNAEIRATGGLPGSWALVKAVDGKLTMDRQGSAGDFPAYSTPIGDITPAEEALFGPEMGRFFQDPNFTPDFPRAAEVFNAFWVAKYPNDPLDGVISIDTVALSYVLDGTGPVQAGGFTLMPDSAVDQLLSDVYQEPDTSKQDEVFRDVARTVFEAATTELQDPIDLLEGIARATREGRFKVAPFVDAEATALDDTRVLGQLPGDDGAIPHITVALNDATASKMSYYLRYRTDVTSLSCSESTQTFGVTMTLSQALSASEARLLPSYVTGNGPAGIGAGSQLVRIHVFAPSRGEINDIKINGKVVGTPQTVLVNQRPAVTLNVLVDSMSDVVVTLEIESGAGQSEGALLDQTPSVIPGGGSTSLETSC
ncbi:MAG: hypothetical protein CMN30_05360 [Sandaracinus sp.]|nr:hypothetical protein [Sandaracinus sp.]